jgi:hypothetical protein
MTLDYLRRANIHESNAGRGHLSSFKVDDHTDKAVSAFWYINITMDKKDLIVYTNFKLGKPKTLKLHSLRTGTVLRHQEGRFRLGLNTMTGDAFVLMLLCCRFTPFELS